MLALAAGCGGRSPPSPESVVRGWSKSLNAGNNDAAADLFAQGAAVIQGGTLLRLQTHTQAVAWNADLPCSGKIVELEADGEEVRATFLLADRGSHPCDGPGARADAIVRVHAGKIVLWHQLDSEPPTLKGQPA